MIILHENQNLVWYLFNVMFHSVQALSDTDFEKKIFWKNIGNIL